MTYWSYYIFIFSGLSTLKLQNAHNALMPSNILWCFVCFITLILREWLTFNPKAAECQWCPDAFKDNKILIWITTYLDNKTMMIHKLNIGYLLHDWLSTLKLQNANHALTPLRIITFWYLDNKIRITLNWTLWLPSDWLSDLNIEMVLHLKT